MKKAFKKIFIVLFTVVVILVGTAPISSAESKYLIVVNSKKNTLNYYVNYTLVRSFRCSTGKLSTPTPQCKTTIVNKIKNRPYYQTHIYDVGIFPLLFLNLEIITILLEIYLYIYM